MAVRVDVELYDREITRLVSPDGDVGRAVRRVADQTANLARAAAPVDNGRLRASIRVQARHTDRTAQAWIFTPLEYGLYVHEGTGVYGPTGQPIRPKRGQYLVFPSRRGSGRGGLVFARQVRGQRPQRYLLDALKRASPWPVDDSVRY